LYEPRSVESFKSDLAYILKYYEPIELKDLIQKIENKETFKKNYFHLSFDDGLREFYDIAAPILKEKGIPATVFLNSDFIDNKDLFFRFKVSILVEKIAASGLLDCSFKERQILDDIARDSNIDFEDYLKKEQPYLTSQQIEQLIQDGFTFGAHSKNHPLYNKLSIEEQLSQTKDSITSITAQFNLAYKVFSFPFTDDGVSLDFFNKIKDEVDLTFGCSGLKDDTIVNHLHRIPMELDREGKEIIKSEYLYYLLKKTVGKNRMVRP